MVDQRARRWQYVQRRMVVGLIAVGALAGCAVPGAPEDQPGAAPDVGSLSKANAEAVTSKLIKTAQAVWAKPGTGATLPQVYGAQALQAAQSNLITVGAGVANPSWPRITVPTGSPMAVSQGPDYPRYILAQTTVPKQNPVVHLLKADSASAGFVVVNSATLLPGAGVKSLPPIEKGSKVINDGADMPIAPSALFDQYAQGLRQGAKSDAPFMNDSFGDQVRASVAARKQAVASAAEYDVQFVPVADSIVALRQAGGDTLVFGAIERRATYTVKPNEQLAPPPEFVALTKGAHALMFKHAQSTTMQLLVFAVPKQGKAQVIAAAEQMVTASGE